MVVDTEGRSLTLVFLEASIYFKNILSLNTTSSSTKKICSQLLSSKYFKALFLVLPTPKFVLLLIIFIFVSCKGILPSLITINSLYHYFFILLIHFFKKLLRLHVIIPIPIFDIIYIL